MGAMMSMIFDVVIFAVLVVTLFYSIRLSRQFDSMQDNKKAFEAFIKSMNAATAKAEAVIKDMRKAVNDEGQDLQERISRAKGLEEELEIIIQAGDSLANRLEALSSSKTAQLKAKKSEKYDDDDDGDAEVAGFKTKAEADLASALKSRKGKA